MAMTVRWRSADGSGLEHLVLEETSTGHRVDAAVIGSADGAAFAARWRLSLDTAWRTRRLDVDLVGADRLLALLGDGEGHWSNADGVPLPALDGAVDIDLLASPFTNTLPIRRLHLPVGGAADILVAWVGFPGLDVHAAPQRYTRIAERRWRFHSLDADFERDIDVDEHGLVVEYPGLFSRVSQLPA